jgi:hypothetical protein
LKGWRYVFAPQASPQGRQGAPSIVQNRRVSGGRTVQRHVLYLGEINDSQRAAWCQTIEAFDEREQAGRQVALLPEDRAPPLLDCDVVHCGSAAAPVPAMGRMLAGVPFVGAT